MSIFDLFKIGNKKKRCSTPKSSDEILNTEVIPIEEIPYSSDYLDDLNTKSMLHSNELHNKHINKIKSIDSDNIIKTDSNPLNSIEKNFLKYIDGWRIDNFNLPGYWTYEYNIDYKYIISKFFNMGYLKTTNYVVNLDKLTMPDLKQVLRTYSKSTTGKKADLISRIENKLSESEIELVLNDGNKYYSLTESGKLITNFKKSITKDIDFEDTVLSYILKDDFENAYSVVCEYNSRKPIQTGLNVDCNNLNLNKKAKAEYRKIKALNLRIDNKNLDNKIKSSFILCNMLGNNYNKAHVIMNRLTDLSKKEIDIYVMKVTNLFRNNLIIQTDGSNMEHINNLPSDIKMEYQIRNNTKFATNLDEIKFFYILKLKTEKAKLNTNYELERLSDGTINVWNYKHYFIGKVRLQYKKHFLIYTIDLDSLSNRIDGELEELIEGIDYWLEYYKTLEKEPY